MKKKTWKIWISQHKSILNLIEWKKKKHWRKNVERNIRRKKKKNSAFGIIRKIWNYVNAYNNHSISIFIQACKYKTVESWCEYMRAVHLIWLLSFNNVALHLFFFFSSFYLLVQCCVSLLVHVSFLAVCVAFSFIKFNVYSWIFHFSSFFYLCRFMQHTIMQLLFKKEKASEMNENFSFLIFFLF